VTIKAILDTNVVISRVFWKGPPVRVLEAWQAQRFRLVISVSILEEYRRVLAEMAGERFSPVLHSILGLIELHSEMVEPIPWQKQFAMIPMTTTSLRRLLLPPTMWSAAIRLYCG